jgi:nucleoside-diphosphate kinase
MKALRIDRALAERHYSEHIGKPFFEDLAAFITSGPVVAMVWEGREAITTARTMMGVTDSAQAAPGTIRGDFSLSKEENVVHGSDGPESAAREIGLFFAEAELV